MQATSQIFTQGARQLRHATLTAVAAVFWMPACVVDVPDVDEAMFRCRSHEDCADAYRCDFSTGYCVHAEQGGGGFGGACSAEDSDRCQQQQRLGCVSSPSGAGQCVPCGGGAPCGAEHACVQMHDGPKCVARCLGLSPGSACGNLDPDGFQCAVTHAVDGDENVCFPCPEPCAGNCAILGSASSPRAPQDRLACLSPTTCAQDVDCPPESPRCLSSVGACVQCVDPAECGANDVCVNNLCQPATLTWCGSHADCFGSTPYCHVDRGHCVQCLVPAQCPNGNTCVPASNTCQPMAGQTCASAADCTIADQACDAVSGTCRPSWCQQCLEGGRTCNYATQRCDDCDIAGSCEQGRVCTSGSNGARCLEYCGDGAGCSRPQEVCAPLDSNGSSTRVCVDCTLAGCSDGCTPATTAAPEYDGAVVCGTTTAQTCAAATCPPEMRCIDQTDSTALCVDCADPLFGPCDTGTVCVGSMPGSPTDNVCRAQCPTGALGDACTTHTGETGQCGELAGMLLCAVCPPGCASCGENPNAGYYEDMLYCADGSPAPFPLAGSSGGNGISELDGSPKHGVDLAFVDSALFVAWASGAPAAEVRVRSYEFGGQIWTDEEIVTTPGQVAAATPSLAAGVFGGLRQLVVALKVDESVRLLRRNGPDQWLGHEGSDGDLADPGDAPVGPPQVVASSDTLAVFWTANGVDLRGAFSANGNPWQPAVLSPEPAGLSAFGVALADPGDLFAVWSQPAQDVVRLGRLAMTAGATLRDLDGSLSATGLSAGYSSVAGPAVATQGDSPTVAFTSRVGTIHELRVRRHDTALAGWRGVSIPLGPTTADARARLARSQDTTFVAYHDDAGSGTAVHLAKVQPDDTWGAIQLSPSTGNARRPGVAAAWVNGQYLVCAAWLQNTGAPVEHVYVSCVEHQP